jgi:hypothetical protein
MPDTLDSLHPQDKRGWLYGDPVVIDDPNVVYGLGIERGTLEAIDFTLGLVLVLCSHEVYPVPFSCVRRITDEDAGRYICDLFEWGEV